MPTDRRRRCPAFRRPPRQAADFPPELPRIPPPEQSPKAPKESAPWAWSAPRPESVRKKRQAEKSPQARPFPPDKWDTFFPARQNPESPGIRPPPSPGGSHSGTGTQFPDRRPPRRESHRRRPRRLPRNCAAVPRIPSPQIPGNWRQPYDRQRRRPAQPAARPGPRPPSASTRKWSGPLPLIPGFLPPVPSGSRKRPDSVPPRKESPRPQRQPGQAPSPTASPQREKSSMEVPDRTRQAAPGPSTVPWPGKDFPPLSHLSLSGGCKTRIRLPAPATPLPASIFRS